MNVPADHKIHEYLRLLEYRGFVVGYQFSNSDGIHGWLSAKENAEFANVLDDLELPEFERSFECMEHFYRKPERGECVFNAGYIAPKPYSFEHLSLAFVRAVCTIAEAERKGVLWGNDLVTYWLDRDN
ncbi:MAG: hypothetical protein IH991_12350 [Planctomycetes bacterium]|nr:hypothetical protein [Planctomycetota bacterium]